MIHVIATIEIADGKREAFLKAFHENVPHVKAEAGCLEYGPTVDMETGIGAQGPVWENVVTVVEKWESLDHLNDHLAAPHMVTYREQVKDIVKGASLQILAPA